MEFSFSNPAQGPSSRRARRRRTIAALAMAGALLAAIAPTALISSVAAVPSTTTFSYAGAPVPIPDAGDLTGTNPGAPALATVASSGLLGPITDVDFSLDGTACSATAGSTTVGIDHTFVNDLKVSLTSPGGTTILLINQTDGGGNNFCQTVLSDEAVNPIQGVVSANAPFTGSFTPANPLSGFDGEIANGTWTLSVQDFFSQDTGNIRAFSVLVTTDPTAVVSTTKTVSGTFNPGDTVTYTLISSNSGGIAAGDNPGNELTDILPSQVTLVSANATSGTSVATIGTNTVTWNGSIPAAGSVTLTITATINAGTEGQAVDNQASIAYDGDGNGTNESSDVSDDPGIGGSGQPTSFTVVTSIPTVTINQAATQTDPTFSSPIKFTAVFSEAVIGFTASDVIIGGTAGATTVVVQGAGPTYTVLISGMTNPGTVTADIPADAAQDGSSNGNLASTSIDNSVTFDVTVGGGGGGSPPAPTASPTPQPSPVPAPSITLTASAGTITWGKSVTLTTHFGTNGAAKSFQLMASHDGVSFYLLANLAANATGDSSFGSHPAANLYYKAVFAGTPDLLAGDSNTIRVLVRQLALLRPANHGAVRSIARGSSITFTTTVRPALPGLPAARVTFTAYHFIHGAWALAATHDVYTNAIGKASWTWTATTTGNWYVRSVANPTPFNANSVRSPLERYRVH
jgi:uncharacterized repeat protein (TIGR01451 family)